MEGDREEHEEKNMISADIEVKLAKQNEKMIVMPQRCCCHDLTDILCRSERETILHGGVIHRMWGRREPLSVTYPTLVKYLQVESGYPALRILIIQSQRGSLMSTNEAIDLLMFEEEDEGRT